MTDLELMVKYVGSKIEREFRRWEPFGHGVPMAETYFTFEVINRKKIFLYISPCGLEVYDERLSIPDDATTFSWEEVDEAVQHFLDTTR